MFTLRKINLCILGFVILSIQTSCKDKKTETPTVESINFNKFLLVDNVGNQLSIDTTQSHFCDHWSAKEESLFKSNYSVNTTNSEKFNFLEFPNPISNNQSEFNLDFGSDTLKRIEIRIVDKYYNVLYSNDSISKKRFLRIDSKIININDNARIYYKYILNNKENRGHNDIMYVK